MKAVFKPHHFLDLLCDAGENGGVFDTRSPYGHAYGACGNLLAAGKIDSVVFTSGADDICGPCLKLEDGVCADIFPPAVAAAYGVDRKYDSNLNLDLGFIGILPSIFSPDTERSVDEILELLSEKLTPAIILMNWPRRDRVGLTLRGLALAIRARKAQKETE